MNLAPDTVTIEAQRNTELLLLDYLRSTNPHIYALWCDHPEYNNENETDEDASGSTTSGSTNTTPSASPESSSCLLREDSSQTPQQPDQPAGIEGTAGVAASATQHFPYQEARFHRTAHIDYASTRVQNLPASLQGMYPSRPWVAYWSLQAADLLGVVESELLTHTPAAGLTAFLHSCLSRDRTCEAELQAKQPYAGSCPDHLQSSDSEPNEGSGAAGASDGVTRPAIGFAGGPLHQWPHLAASYAACSALAILAVHDGGVSLRRLPRAAIKRWLLALRNDDGSFRVHGGGESDIRASYCAAVITALLCLDDPATFDAQERLARTGDALREDAADVQFEPVLTLRTAQFVASCQTHEGGFTCSATASEAHGAYTQCGLAALLLMRQPHLVHQASLRRWLAARQLNCEGGFNGRTNKLVDSCYSHWIGASHVLLRAVEAYTKCFAAAAAAAAPIAADVTERVAMGEEESVLDGAAETGGEEASATFLRAREVVLLDHVQLLDAKLIQSTETTAWDRAEVGHLKRVDLVDQFLSADDACMREAANKRAATVALYDDVLRAHESSIGAVAKDEEMNVEGLVLAFRARQDFLYADCGDYYFNQRKLQDYILRCCQDAEVGGLMDKPGTAHDAYHTCYSLSGMSAAQNLQYLTHASAAAAATQRGDASSAASAAPYLTRAFAQSYLPKREKAGGYGVVLSIPGPSLTAEAAVLRTTSPIFNVHQSAVLAALKVWTMKSFL